MFDKLVVVTLKTRLEELIERFNTREQAKFYIEHMGLNFADYDREHETYTAAVRLLLSIVGEMLLTVPANVSVGKAGTESWTDWPSAT